jgi:hypothetical protein
MLVIDLGNLAVNSDMKDRAIEDSSSPSLHNFKEEEFYDRFRINLTHIQLLMTKG